MKQPNNILATGTKVITHAELEPTFGMSVPQLNLDSRRPSIAGKIHGYVPGHGGDVYWVRHEGIEAVAPYCFTEFELDQESPTPE
jgi:hypothetical protein